MNKERFICINNEGYPVSLEMFATYEAIPDDEAAKRDLIRIIDESGEDYLYPKSRFVLADLPTETPSPLVREISEEKGATYNVDPETDREFREQA